MKKLNMIIAGVLVVLTSIALAGDGDLFSVGDDTNYFKVNSDGTFESSGRGTIAALSGLAKLTSGVISAAVAGEDYLEPDSIAGNPAVVGSVATLTNTVAITSKDAGEVTLAARRLIRVWLAETAYGVPSTNNIVTLTLSGGTAIETVTANADYIYLTAATGIATAEVVGTAAGTNYIMVADGGSVTSAAVVFEAGE